MEPAIDSDKPVIVSEVNTKSGHTIGRLTLNKPKALNALDLQMAEIMLMALRDWQSRDDMVCVIVDASGEKAFCAGGDIVSMYKAMQKEHGSIPSFLQSFFTTEYMLDYAIHAFDKPVVVWGSGIVMGGGMGLLNGASHRVVTETSRLAMPEITIGLYPDVGGSYFLPRLPGKSGLFLGLTGANINAADALYLGLADHLCHSQARESVFESLSEKDWDLQSNLGQQVSQAIRDHALSELEVATSNVSTHQALIDAVCSHESLPGIVDAIANMDTEEDKWLDRAKKTLSVGSPITAHLVYQQCIRGNSLTLAECFRMELIMSCRCGEKGEFEEGIRALLIEKDNAPAWKFSSVSDVPEDVVNAFFQSPWDEASHPLAALGEQE